MKILVKIDEAECFRHGFDAPKIKRIELDLDPQMFKDAERDYIADNMIDGEFQGPYNEYTDPRIINPAIEKLFKIWPPDLDGFIDAVRRGMDFNAMKDEIPF